MDNFRNVISNLWHIRAKASCAVTLAALLGLNGCTKDYGDVIDRKAHLSRKAFEENLLPVKKGGEAVAAAPAAKAASEPSIPDIAPIVVAPQPPSIGKDKLISLSVTEDVPLKDVLIELGRLAELDIQIDPSISGGIILRVKDKPLNEVLDKVAMLANLRYTVDKGIIKVERDTPYVVNYSADFLNLARSSKSNVSISTSVGGGSSGGGGDAGGSSGSGSAGTSSGSTNTITSTYDGDLWGSIEKDIKSILKTNSSAAGGSSGSTASTSAAPAAASSGGGAQMNPLAALAGAAAGATSSAAASSSGGGTAAGSTASEEDDNKSGSFIAVNKQAGVIIVMANSRQHADIKRYLDRVKGTVSSQVLIEAKVVEVSLDDEFRTGINWNVVDQNLGLGLKANFTNAVSGQTDLATIGVLDKFSKDGGKFPADTTNLDSIAQLTQLFGTTRTLSSPRLHAMNNQQAVLSFASNQVYFQLDVQTTDAQVGPPFVPAKTTVKSTPKTVPIGIILSLQPSINPETNDITMNIHPTISKITSYINDPGVAYIAATATSTDAKTLTSPIPVVEVKELDSILKIKSGQVMIIGGLMEERSENTDSGIPFVSTVPWVGNLFKTVKKTSNVVQTVIFIKATVIPTSDSVTPEDKHFYRTYTRDPNPLTF